MFFLQGLYDWLEQLAGGRYNHFWLVHLSFRSLDKALQVYLFWIIYRLIYLLRKKSKQEIVRKNKEIILWLFVFYVILLYQLTVFRWGFNFSTAFEQLRSLDHVNWQPFVETLKLTNGLTLFDFIYNLFGNIFWFVPMGLMLPALLKKSKQIKTLLIGFGVSLSIEVMQFIFQTGISDIDDVIFNTLGTLLGLLVFSGISWVKNKVKNRLKED
ncbi:VanZ family protein [Isobaculum melis]|uniref:Glycopeptide antibiotics resistance protein n=1 Tax=Isobaculum melis TaxID=142588 RepID=A0A1H9SPY1_9LACT|nr:VanZ family protein [Isobaculum melis]SER86934.1 Glycopeptide antibiotics resistance protein [Isobaculum melis]